MDDANKMMTPEDKAVDAQRPFFYPDANTTIFANSQEEADTKLAEKQASANIKS